MNLKKLILCALIASATSVLAACVDSGDGGSTTTTTGGGGTTTPPTKPPPTTPPPPTPPTDPNPPTPEPATFVTISLNYAETQDEQATWGGLVNQFIISYGTSSGNYTKTQTLLGTDFTPEVPTGGPYEMTTFTTKLNDTFDPGVTYYFVVKACIQNNCSVNSSEVSYEVPAN